MARYPTWNDVEDVWPEAGNIETATAARDAILDQASAVVDAFLSPVMHTPLEVEDESGEYPTVVVLGAAAIAAHLVARRRQTGDDDQWSGEYGGRSYYGTRFLHEGLSLYLQPLYEARAALPEQTTAGETLTPRVVESFSTTNGKFRARYSGGRYLGNKETTYVVTVTSSGGTVAGDDLVVSVVRDNDETVVAALTINSSHWYGIENGLQIAFSDADSSPVWTQDEYVNLTCIPSSNEVVGGSLRTVDVPLG